MHRITGHLPAHYPLIVEARHSTWWTPEGDFLLVSHWKDGILEGDNAEYDTAGHVLRGGKYRNGVQDGSWTSTGMDGKHITTNYKKGNVVVPPPPKEKHPRDSLPHLKNFTANKALTNISLRKD